MWLPIRIFHPDREADAERQRTIRERLALSLEALKNRAPDTFLGRKTQSAERVESAPPNKPPNCQTEKNPAQGVAASAQRDVLGPFAEIRNSMPDGLRRTAQTV